MSVTVRGVLARQAQRRHLGDVPATLFLLIAPEGGGLPFEVHYPVGRDDASCLAADKLAAMWPRGTPVDAEGGRARYRGDHDVEAIVLSQLHALIVRGVSLPIR